MRLYNIPRSATSAWGPSGSILACGTAAGTMNESFDSSGTLELFALGGSSGTRYECFHRSTSFCVLLSHPHPHVSISALGKVPTNEKFHALAWTSVPPGGARQFDHGILAGGMDSGVVSLFDPAPLIDVNRAGENPLLTSVPKHTGPVKSLDFNPEQVLPPPAFS